MLSVSSAVLIAVWCMSASQASVQRSWILVWDFVLSWVLGWCHPAERGTRVWSSKLCDAGYP